MGMLTCDDGEQPAWCPTTQDEVLPSILGSLPSGVVWNGDRQDGTVKNGFWRALSDIIAWTYSTLCSYEQEFYCDTAQYLDPWIRAWALDENCDPYGFNLCAKVTALGGQTYAFYEDLLLKSGYVIHCTPCTIPEAQAGRMMCGCTTLGPRPSLDSGSNLGYAELCQCSYGDALGHPDPEYWKVGSVRTNLRCFVPGTNLGLFSGQPDCCMIAGYYEAPYTPDPQSSDACANSDVVITFPPVNEADVPDLRLLKCDSTGKFTDYGHMYVWYVDVDVAASNALRNVTINPNNPGVSLAGRMVAGCTPLCNDLSQDFVVCLLEKIKPAHTQIIYRVIQP